MPTIPDFRNGLAAKTVLQLHGQQTMQEFISALSGPAKHSSGESR